MTTPILTAALARKPRRNPRPVRTRKGEGRGQKPAHNYLAQAAKKTAGAPLGNRHAARRDPECVERLARVRALVQRIQALADAAIAAIGQGAAERARLTELLHG